MLSINTNLPSLTAQRSLTNSTKLLNQAIERMSTGFKINHASDNAANYSISTNMTTKIGAYEVAEDNVASGLDLLATAEGSLDLISDKLTRLRALAEQAANGTYGEQSLKAINSEANAIVDEIERIYSTTEYNGIKLFGETRPQFIDEVQQLSEEEALAEGYTIIRTVEDLHDMDNSTGKFILMNDIDLSSYSTGEGWEPINSFKGTFDGNGYVISNLYINRPDGDHQGLFGSAGERAEIKNLGLKNVNVLGQDFIAGLVGDGFIGRECTITNCYVTGSVRGNEFVGGLSGQIGETVNFKNNYMIGNVTGSSSVGGLIGDACDGLLIENNYVIGNVQGNNSVGGLIGCQYADIVNSYYSGNVTGTGTNVGELVGEYDSGTIDTLSGVVNEEDIPLIRKKVVDINFQAGIDSAESSQINLNTAFNLNVSHLRGIGLGGNYLESIDSLLNTVSAKQTEYGAAENRLESVLESIAVNVDNLTSSRSTLRDADIADVSSEYIRQQILQQASATLLATANQSPALALQLL